MKTYSIGEVSKMLGLSISTLRYYDKKGLLQQVERSEGGIRVFKDADIRHLHMLECLKSTGMSLKNIKQFFDWCEEGDSTIEKRHQMFLDRKKELEQQMQTLQNSLDMVNYKCEFYQIAKDEQTCETPRLVVLSRSAAQKSDYIKEIVGED